MRMWQDVATPPRSSRVLIAEAAVVDSRQRRRARWMGSLEESVGLARMAFRFVPTEEELKPILPTMPAYTLVVNKPFGFPQLNSNG